MATTVMGRVKLWMGIGAASVILLGAAMAWPGDDDDAINRDQEDSERRREAVVKVDYQASKTDAIIRWGKSGALTREDNPSMPFERVVEVQRGDRVLVVVLLKKFDRTLKCSVQANGTIYEGVRGEQSCEARAVIK